MADGEIGEVTATVRNATHSGFASVVLENSRLRAVVIPELGGRVWELCDKLRERQWIWHREDVSLSVSCPGDAYDEVWAGGWEELFPNDAPGAFEGRLLHDHGEWWATPWSVVEVGEGAEALLRLVAGEPIHGARCTKEFRLTGDGSAIEVSYRIENQSPTAYHFLFKQHLPVALTAACRLVLPGGVVTAVDPSFGTILPGPGPFAWPMVGSLDLRVVPDRSAASREFLYVRDVPGAWCGVDDLAQGASLRMQYDAAVMPYLWLFLTYGGWRDCYTVVLEPCTNMPKDLRTAANLGQSAKLAIGGVFETSVTVALGALSEPG